MKRGDRPFIRPGLPTHEWLAVVGILGILVILVIVSASSGHSDYLQKQEKSSFVEVKKVTVTVKGAVQSPGRYQIKQGTSVGELLAFVEPAPDADLSKIKTDQIINRTRTLNIPKIQIITVFIEGAVNNPGPIQLPKGAKLEDVIPHLHFLEGADPKKLQRKRKLKDFEIVHVPTQ